MTRKPHSAVLLSLITTGLCWAQTPFELKVEAGSGLLAFTFKTAVQNHRVQARAYLPDDLAPDEPFSATTEGPANYTLAFAGQSAKASQGVVHWNTPAAQKDYPLILRDARGVEVARATVHGRAPAAARAGDRQFHLPRFIQAIAPAPVLGPFDGNAETTRVTVDGKPARVVAESLRKAIVLCPDVLGVVNYAIAKGSQQVLGQTRSLRIDVKESGMLVSGLRGLQEDIPFARGSQYLILRAANVAADGTYVSGRNAGDPSAPDEPMPEPLRLAFSQTPADDVALILHGPRKQQATQLRALDFDPLPVLANFLDDPDLGGDAAYAMLEVDPATSQKQALKILFQSMPDSGPNIQRIGMGWFLEHYDAETATALSAHAAALRVLGKPQASRTDAMELALYVTGFTGNPDDFPVLEKNFQYRNGWGGLKRVQDASEAALARLGSREHIARIRAELALPFRQTPEDAIRVSQSLQKAGFSGLAEFLPAICPHLNDPAVLDIDVTWDPKFSAMSALNAIANHTSPLALPRMKTAEEWKQFCAGVR